MVKHMKTLVIGSKNFGKKNNPVIFAKNLNADIYYFEDLVFDISRNDVKIFAGEKNILTEGYELAICLGWYKNGKKSYYRDIAYSLAKAFEANGIKYWNSEMGMQRSTTKLSQMMIMALNDIQMPKTLFSLTDDLILARLQDNQKYIVKAAAASRGKSNYLLDSKNTIKDVLSTPDTIFLVQEFIPNDHDLRVICFGGEPKLALKRSRTSEETHLNNTSQGASAEWIEIPEDLKEPARKISKLLGRDMGGIDFIESVDLDNSSRLCYCLEVNAIPQLTSGTDVERKMAALIETVNGTEK